MREGESCSSPRKSLTLVVSGTCVDAHLIPLSGKIRGKDVLSGLMFLGFARFVAACSDRRVGEIRIWQSVGQRSSLEATCRNLIFEVVAGRRGCVNLAAHYFSGEGVIRKREWSWSLEERLGAFGYAGHGAVNYRRKTARRREEQSGKRIYK